MPLVVGEPCCQRQKLFISGFDIWNATDAGRLKADSSLAERFDWPWSRRRRRQKAAPLTASGGGGRRAPVARARLVGESDAVVVVCACLQVLEHMSLRVPSGKHKKLDYCVTNTRTTLCSHGHKEANLLSDQQKSVFLPFSPTFSSTNHRLFVSLYSGPNHTSCMLLR